MEIQWVEADEVPEPRPRSWGGTSKLAEFCNELKKRPGEWAIYSLERRSPMVRSSLPLDSKFHTEIRNSYRYLCTACDEPLIEQDSTYRCPKCDWNGNSPMDENVKVYAIYMRWQGGAGCED